MSRVAAVVAVAAGLAGVVGLSQVGQPDAAGLSYQGSVLADIHDLSPQELRAGGFVLTSPQDVQIDAVGAEKDNSTAFGRFLKRGVFASRSDDNDRDLWPANAWIVDLGTRQVVWELRRAETRRDDGLRAFTGTVHLPAGSYEVYYGSFAAEWMSTESNDRGRGDRATRREYGGHYVDDDSYRRFRISVHGNGHPMADAELAQARAAAGGPAVVTLKADSADQSLHIGFSLDKPVALSLLSVGEAREDGPFDYGWIVNTATHQRVWEMSYEHSDPAGGADKNRMVQESITLPAGRYAAFYVTDGTHDPSSWNAMPPFDPDDWGLTIRVATAADKSAVHTFAYDPAPAGEPIVQMVRLGNDETRSEGFTLTQPLDVHVYAIGEADGDEAMADYGWIMNAATHRRVWTMDYDHTEHAGGAQKNRVFDGVVHLDAGNYVVYFRTDGSHAYGDWNDSRPLDPEHWGITVLPNSGGKVDHSVVKAFSTEPEGTVLAQLVRVRNGEQRRRTFRLDRDADIHVYAIGEGVNGEMADYAWIENASGETVWEMRYGMTERAGGARKNRMFDGTVHLAAGQYVVRYKSDDSHGYGDWNDTPPDDPGSWGVTVTLPTVRH